MGENYNFYGGLKQKDKWYVSTVNDKWTRPRNCTEVALNTSSATNKISNLDIVSTFDTVDTVCSAEKFSNLKTIVDELDKLTMKVDYSTVDYSVVDERPKNIVYEKDVCTIKPLIRTVMYIPRTNNIKIKKAF